MHGIDGAVCNIISETHTQVKARFVFHSQRRCPIVDGAPDNNCWSHAGSYLGELSFQQVINDSLHTALFSAGDAKTGFVQVLFDEQAV